MVEMLQVEVEGMCVLVIDDVIVSWMIDGLEVMGDEVDVIVIQVENLDLVYSNLDDLFVDVCVVVIGMLGGVFDVVVLSIFLEELFVSGCLCLVDNDFGGVQMVFEIFVMDNLDYFNVGEVWYWFGQIFYVQDNFGDVVDVYIVFLCSQLIG